MSYFQKTWGEKYEAPITTHRLHCGHSMHSFQFRVLCQQQSVLPGDAFFPTELTKADVEELQTVKTGDRQFTYSNFRTGGFGCGFAGYRMAVIRAVDDDFSKNLSTVYSKIRKHENRELIEIETDGKTELVEKNPVRVLFYPSEFSFPRFRLGLRYNENWAAEVVRFGHIKSHVQLGCLVDGRSAIMES